MAYAATTTPTALAISATSAASGTATPTVAATKAAVTPTAAATATVTKTTTGGIKIMPLGDSLTQGGPAVPLGHQSYRGYLYTRLVRAGYKVDFVGSQNEPPHGGGDPDHEGHGGYTIGPDKSYVNGSKVTTNLYDHLEEYFAANQPDYILLLVGINDMFPDIPDRPVVPAEAGDRYKNFIAKIRRLQPNAKILVSTLVPIEKKPDRTGWPEANKLNDAIRQAAKDDPQTIFLVDTFKLGGFADGDWIDGIHLRKSGAVRLANMWFNALVKVLPKTVKK